MLLHPGEGIGPSGIVAHVERQVVDAVRHARRALGVEVRDDDAGGVGHEELDEFEAET